MLEPELFLLFIRPMNGAGIRSMLAISGEQIDRPALADWVQRRGLQAEWQLVCG
jgi:hypothetical protein